MNEVQALEDQVEGFKKLQARKEMSDRLLANPDFRSLILEEFLVNECASYAQNSANPQLTAEERADCLGIAQAAGHLKRWLSVVHQMGKHAENNMTDLLETLDTARAEELESVEGPE